MQAKIGPSPSNPSQSTVFAGCAATDFLLVLAEQAAADVGDDELLEGLMFHLTETLGSNVASPQGWQRLELILRQALEAGISPGEISGLLERQPHSRP